MRSEVKRNQRNKRTDGALPRLHVGSVCLASTTSEVSFGTTSGDRPTHRHNNVDAPQVKLVSAVRTFPTRWSKCKRCTDCTPRVGAHDPVSSDTTILFIPTHCSCIESKP
ncbi:MAG: hypothetical protein MHM6MM_002546 [Cercozoa sp. M6MM]